MSDIQSHVLILSLLMEKRWVWLGFERDRSAGKQALLPPNAPSCIVRKWQSLDSTAFPSHTDEDGTHQPGTLRGLACVSLGLPYEGNCSVGWGDEGHFLREHFLEGAGDGFVVHVVKAFYFPVWESMPQVTKRVRQAHRANISRSRGVAISERYLAGLFGIESWCIAQENDDETVAAMIAGLSLQSSQHGDRFISVEQCLGSDIAAAKSFPCLFLPVVIGQLVFAGKWTELVVLARWTLHAPMTWNAHLPQHWLDTTINTKTDSLEPAVLTKVMAEMCIQNLRMFAGTLAHDLDAELAEGTKLGLQQCVSALSSHRDSLCPQFRRLRSLTVMSGTFIRQILAALDLQNRSQLRTHVKKFLLCFPEAVRPAMDLWAEKGIVSKSHLSRGQLFLDIAMLLFQRARLQNMGQFVQYAWGDSTTKKGSNIYIIRYRCIKVSLLVELSRAWRWLCLHLPPTGDQEPLSDDEMEERRRCSQSLFDAVQLHTQIPQLIGHGRSTLVDKVGAHVHSTLLEAGDLEALKCSLNSCVCWCSDMGVESGIPECKVSNFDSLLPEFVRPSRITIMAGDAEGAIEEEFLGDAEPVQNLMQNAIHVPGMCHAIHNASLNLDSALSDFKWFIDQVEILDNFIGKKQMRDRFVEVVLRNSPQYPNGKDLFGKFSGQLYRERWGEVATYLNNAYPLLVFLRRYWDETAFQSGLEEGTATGPTMNPQTITALLKDDFFLIYWQMQMSLRDVIQRLLRWSEGCTCHSTMLVDASAYVQEKSLRSEIFCPEEVRCHCPMMGCRAAELVAGQLDSFAEELCQTQLNEFLSSRLVQLSAEQWGRLQHEWRLGSAFICENLKIRLGFFQALPWVILGGTHPDIEKAKACLRRARFLWEELSEDARLLQHQKARELFETEVLRDELNKFLTSDAELGEVPGLEAYLAPLTFVQVAERIIEAAHKDIGGPAKHGTLSVMSIRVRAPELLRTLALEAESFQQLVDAFDAARRVRTFAESFPCYARHPDLLSLQASKLVAKVQTSSYVKTIRGFLYRDTRVQHGNISQAAAVHKSSKMELDKTKAAFKPKDPTLSLEVLFANEATTFVRQICEKDPGAVLSIRDELFMPLISRPGAIHRPSHAPCTIPHMQKNDMLVTKLKNVGDATVPCVSALSGVGSQIVNLCTVAVEMGLDNFLSQTQVWRRPSKVMLSLPGMPNDISQVELSRVLTYMVENQALPDFNKGVGFRACSRDHQILERLIEKEYATETVVGVCLTPEAVAKLDFNHVLASPQPFMTIRDAPDVELSCFELMVSLKNEGWSWLPLPKKVQDRKELSFQVGSALEWRTAGITVCKSYLLCLMRANLLKDDHGVLSISHGLPAEVYDMILLGMSPQLALQDFEKTSKKRGQGKKRQNLEILDDVDLPEEDTAHTHPKRLALLPPDGGGEGEVDVLPSLLDLEHVAACDQLGEDAAPSAPLVESAPVAVALPDAEVAASSERSHRGSRPSDSRQRLPKWGSFSFHRKSAALAPPHGGIEAVCRFHALNDKTGCKKFVRIQGSADSDEEQCLNILRHWCNQATRFDRQRKHMRMPLRPQDIPATELIELQKLDSDPPTHVLTDKDLDADAEPAAASSSVRLPKAASKVKASSKGKATAKAKATDRKGSDADDDDDDDSSSNESSSSSSDTPSSSSS